MQSTTDPGAQPIDDLLQCRLSLKWGERVSKK